MNREFDEMVRDSMTWFTDGADVPAGFLARAREHLRRRRRTQMSLLTAGAAVLAAAAVLAGTAWAGSAPQHLAAKTGGAKTGTARTGTAKGLGRNVPIQTTAMVIGRVDRALARAAGTDPVAYTRETLRGARLFVFIPHRGPVQVRANVIESWSRDQVDHVEVRTRTGRPVLGTLVDLRSGSSVETQVSYPERVWWRGTYLAYNFHKPKISCGLGEIDRTPAQWTREVRNLLSCGAAVAGYDRLDGVKAIKLKLSSSYQHACAGANDRRSCGPQPVGWSGFLWANASSYLPVRLVSYGKDYRFQIDFGWLAPNAANLAKLKLRIPAGFRHV